MSSERKENNRFGFDYALAKDCPCRKCDVREIECHDGCGAYKVWKLRMKEKQMKT